MSNLLRTVLLNVYALVVLLPYGLALMAFWAIDDFLFARGARHSPGGAHR